MFDKLFDAYGKDPHFQKLIMEMVDDMMIDVNNDLKFKKIDLDNPVVAGMVLINFKSVVGINFLRTINLVMNGDDETAFGNVNVFLDKIEELYLKAENQNKKSLQKKYGGI